MAKGKSRDKSKEALWRRTVRLQRQSGLTIREFCHKHQVRETAFYFWRRELDRRGKTFLPVRVAPEPARQVTAEPRPALPQPASRPSAGKIVIMLAGGRRVHVAPPVDRQALADVLAVLEAAAC
jgi:transposase-like protein